MAHKSLFRSRQPVVSREENNQLESDRDNAFPRMRKRDLAEPRLGTTMVERRRRRLGGNGDNGLPKADSLSNPEHDQEHNPYLALRQAKIARNQARLEELGLVGCGSVVGGGGSDTRISKGCSSSGSGHIAKSAPLNRKITAQKTAQPRKHGLRRSTRLSDKANRSTFGTYKVQRPRGRGKASRLPTKQLASF